MTDNPFEVGPNWGVMTDRDVFERARDLPTGYGEMLSSTIAESFITSPGLGTAVRDVSTPERVPSRDVVTPPEMELRDPLAQPTLGQDQPFRIQPPPGTWLETEDEYQIRRKRAGAITKEEYEASPNFRTGVPYDSGMTQDRAAALASWYDASKARQDTIARGPGGFLGTSLWLGGMVIGSAADPVNYIPVFGPEVRAAQIAKFGRLGGSMLTSAADAALNTAAASAITAGSRASFGDDVTWQGFLTDVAIGAVIGGAFGAATAKWEGWQVSRSANELERVVEARRAMNDAIHDLVHDRPVEITPAIQDAVEKAGRLEPEAQKAALPENVRSAIDAPDDINLYMSAKAYGERLSSPYMKDGETIASSRTTPFEGELPPVGTWRIADYSTNYGREIEQLRLVDINALILKELRDGKLDITKQGDDARYAGWIEEGRRPPPIEVVVREDGSLSVIDGHRRVLAAQQAGRTQVEAWVSDLVDSPTAKMPDGTPIKTSLTYELAQSYKAQAPSADVTRMAVASPQPDTPDPVVTKVAAKVGKPAKDPSDEFGIELKPVKPPAEQPKKSIKAVRGEDGRISGLEIDNGATADLAKQFGISVKTGDFPEMAEFDQLVALGRVTPEELAEVQKAMQLEVQSDAYAKALEAAAICRVGS